MKKSLTAITLTLAAVFAHAGAIPLPDFVNSEHDFFPVPDSTMTLSGCTTDEHRFFSEGHMVADQQEMQAAHLTDLPVKRFRHGLQSLFAKQVGKFVSTQFVTGVNTQGFDGVGSAMTNYYKEMKTQTGVTMLFIPSGDGGISTGVDPACRPV